MLLTMQISDIQVAEFTDTALTSDENVTVYDPLIIYYEMVNNDFNEINIISKLNNLITTGNSLTFVCIHT